MKKATTQVVKHVAKLVEFVHETPRRCSYCGDPARFWRYLDDTRGGVDKSSRRAVCELHTKTVADFR